MSSRPIGLQLFPEEREVLLKWIFIPEVRSQLEACAASDEVATITVTPTDVNWLSSDLTHGIVNTGHRDSVTVDLSGRFEFVERWVTTTRKLVPVTSTLGSRTPPRLGPRRRGARPHPMAAAAPGQEPTRRGCNAHASRAVIHNADQVW